MFNDYLISFHISMEELYLLDLIAFSEDCSRDDLIRSIILDYIFQTIV